MRIILIGRGKMGTLIQETARAAGDEVVAVCEGASEMQLLKALKRS